MIKLSKAMQGAGDDEIRVLNLVIYAPAYTTYSKRKYRLLKVYFPFSRHVGNYIRLGEYADYEQFCEDFNAMRKRTKSVLLKSLTHKLISTEELPIQGV
jgi:hypothetical protein